jgi:hypothetical protein
LVPPIIHAAAGWTGYASIAELTPTSHGRYLVKLKSTDNPSDCKDKTTFYQDYSTPASRLMYNTLLEAVAYKKQVRVYVTGKCELNGYSEISSVAIVP